MCLSVLSYSQKKEAGIANRLGNMYNLVGKNKKRALNVKSQILEIKSPSIKGLTPGE